MGINYIYQQKYNLRTLFFILIAFCFSDIKSQSIEDHNKDLLNLIFIKKDSFNLIFEENQSKFIDIGTLKNLKFARKNFPRLRENEK